MRLTCLPLATLAVLAGTTSVLADAPGPAHAGLARRQAAAVPEQAPQLDRRGHGALKRRQTAAQKKKAALALASKEKAASLSKSKSKSKSKSLSKSRSLSKSKSVAKAKSLSLSKIKVNAAKVNTSSLKKYSSSSKKAASAAAKFSTSSLKKYSTSSKAAATSSRKAASVLAAAASKSAASAAAAASKAKTTTTTTARTTTTTTRSTTTTSSKTSTTTSKAAATVANAAASSAASTTSNKKGLGYNTPSFTTAFGNAIGWVYNWGQNAGGNLYPGVEYVPMLWGTGSESTWIAAATQAIEEGATALLGYNEPDFADQSNITPARAAQGWKTYMEPFYGKAKLISPAMTNQAGIGSPWMDQFLSNCTGCHIDAIALHWYDSATNTGYINAYFDDAAKRWGKKIWVTEYAGSGTVAQQQTFLQYANAYFEDTAAIERYAGFGDFAGNYVNSDGSLTALGTTYKNAV